MIHLSKDLNIINMGDRLVEFPSMTGTVMTKLDVLLWRPPDNRLLQ